MKWTGEKDADLEKMITEYHATLIEKLKAYTVPMPSFKHRRRGYGFVPMPDLEKFTAELNVELSKRLAVRAGDASPKLHRIRLNYRLLKDKPKELLDTYGHELAHLIASQLYKFRVGHGSEWAQIMIHLGLKPDRCHDLDVSQFRRKRMRYIYTCKCHGREYKLTQARHARSERAREATSRSVFYCSHCHEYLMYTSGPVYI